jgi:hypothetical protein
MNGSRACFILPVLAQRGWGGGPSNAVRWWRGQPASVHYRTAPDRSSFGNSVTAASSGCRRCHGLSAIFVPAWRLIFQAIYSAPPAKVKLAFARRGIE